MPTTEQHKRQFELNKATIAAVRELNPPPNDWLVTMAFYAAVHLIEGVIVENFSKGTGDHQSRKRYINMISKLKPIRADYLNLEHYSHDSRYMCRKFKNSDVDKILESLMKIEKVVKSA